MANMGHRANFRNGLSKHCGDMAVFRFFKIASVRHLEFVVRLYVPPAKCSWWSLSLYKIWFESAL